MDSTHDNTPTHTGPSAGPGADPFADHARRWEAFCYVYPVISRRSRGLSIGINLNPDTICNFDCVYCQVEKREPPKPEPVNTAKLKDEIGQMLAAVASGAIWDHPRFTAVDKAYRRLNDLAFSGDGEPTAAPCFHEAVNLAAEALRQHALHETKLVLITNATLLDRPGVEAAIQAMDTSGGEVWAKLDAGTQAYYDRVDRSAVPLDRVLKNILACGERRPIVIQSMFLKLHNHPIPDDEFDAYADRVAELIDRGCRVKSVQVYTVARKPLEGYVSALEDAQLRALASRLESRLRKTTPAGAAPLIEVYGSDG